MLDSGTKLGPYEVVSSLGACGMGEVYRAHDTSLGRDVAIKVLPETFAADAERLARFEREARPKWNRNGKELFCRFGNKMMVDDVTTGPDLTLSQPRVLFEQRYAFGSAQTIPNCDVSPDGQRFAMVKDDSNSGR